MSRPHKPIDWERVDELLMCGCLGTEIAAQFDMHPNTFYDRVTQKYGISFTDYCSEKRALGDSLLREAQFKKATKKLDNTMLVWLGKQRLGQRESPQDVVVNEELAKRYTEMMSLLSTLQASRNQEQKTEES